jgi:hypothetical protein
MVEKIGFKIFLLRWIPHELIDELRKQRDELAQQLLRVLKSQQRINFRDIATGDMSRCLQHFNHRQIWCVLADEVLMRVIHMITTQKRCSQCF